MKYQNQNRMERLTMANNHWLTISVRLFFAVAHLLIMESIVKMVEEITNAILCYKSKY
jgi:hypothetical protein